MKNIFTKHILHADPQYFTPPPNMQIYSPNLLIKWPKTNEKTGVFSNFSTKIR
jgi:hypothetical protein